jgi:hypothetical protein
MFKFNSFRLLLLLAGTFLLGTSCKKEADRVPLAAVTGTFLVNGSNEGNFGLFSFERNALVNNETDSISNNWDFGLRFASFITNSGISGPGNAGAIVQTAVFDDVTEAPESGYRTDLAVGDLAVKDSDWYDYNPVTRSFSPRAGQVIIMRTGSGKYAKMEVLKAEPTDDNGEIVVPPTRPTKIKYTIRYVYQANGTRTFYAE